eukprot:TRINITY_DN15154_c0_g1_i2.p1 TRINITY_DN15154_c0_g1~~TRINITY_DN15154_c0_g1_i2.p1  ORF type:complete len:422 (+),score=92.78 TRINITY_DN15154_c0_g1_i2:63-1328(+)
MANLDFTWFMTLFVLGILVFSLFKRYGQTIEHVEEDVVKGGGRRKKKKGKQQQQQQQQPQQQQEGSLEVTEPEQEPKKKPSKPLKISDPGKGARDAIARADGTEDDDGFKTVVPGKSKDNKRRIAALPIEKRKELQKRKEQHEDDKWNVVPSATHNGPNAYSQLSTSHKTKTVGKALPVKKSERVIGNGTIPTQAMMEKIMSQRAPAEESGIDPVDLNFRINVQGKWYEINELLATNNFDHAPQMAKVFISNPESCQGGMFCKINSKMWAGEHTADEPWMVTGLVLPLCKILNGDATDVEATIAWQDGAALRLTLPSPTSCLNLQHVRASSKHPSGVFKVDLKDFSSKFVSAYSSFLTFAQKMEDGCTVQEAKLQTLLETNEPKATRLLENLETVRNKLPNSAKLRKNMDALQEALSNRWP